MPENYDDLTSTDYSDDYNDTETNYEDDSAPQKEVKRALEVIKVSTRSRATSVAGAIAWVIRDHGRAEVQAIGAGAVNQAVKAMAIARGYLERDALDLNFAPRFTEVDIDGQERTAVRFSVESYAIEVDPIEVATTD